jgi:lysyl-tRNA synthetase class 1
MSVQHRIMAADHVTSVVGSVHDDPLGRLLQRATMDIGLSGIWLHAALERIIGNLQPMPEHFAAWANRLGLFDDTTFLLEGVRAWYEGDLIKAVHVLVPQVERGLRSIVGQLGHPVTKPHPTVPDIGVAVSMGDILYREEITAALGPDLTLHFLTLYADPRGMNLRNRVAHGQLDAVTTSLVQSIIHTLLLFGIWKELAEKRR